MKQTALYPAHLRIGAKMVEFAGWEMPILYKSVLDEARAVRLRWGIFDVSHMGRAWFRGQNAFPLLAKLVPSDLSRLGEGEAMYTVLTNEGGGVVDDIILYRLGTEEFLVVFNAANWQKDLNWFRRWVATFSPQPEVEDRTEQTVMIAVQGPEAVGNLQAIAEGALETVPRFGATRCKIKGVTALAGRTGYTGEDGFELIVEAAAGEQVWEALLNAGATPCGLGARDVLRLEAGLHLYGHELSETINPLEAGLGWLLSARDDYLGASEINRVRQQGVTRKLMGIVMQERVIPREGYAVYSQGQKVGTVTSGVFSPTLEKSIGMAFIQAEYAQVGTPCEVEIRGKRYAGTLTSRRFLKERSK